MIPTLMLSLQYSCCLGACLLASQDLYGQSQKQRRLSRQVHLQVQPDIARAEYEVHGQEGLDQLLAALDGGFEGVGTALLEEPSALTKVVLARRSDVKYSGQLDPLALLHALQVCL